MRRLVDLCIGVFFFLALTLLAGFGAIQASASLTGSFRSSLTLTPIPCGALPFAGFGTGVVYPVDCENTFTQIDLSSTLTVNWTVSGLTFGIQSDAGFAGVESLIASLKATLGTFNIVDTFVFAAPFATTTLVINPNGPQPESESIIEVVSPGDLLFVKKRADVSAGLAGLLLDNLAIIEDVNFPNPAAAPPLGGYGPQSQSFGFGDVLTISGQTVSGISLQAQTGFCAAQLSHSIKNHSFSFSVDPNCGKSNLGFSFERVTVNGIPLVSNLLGTLTQHCTNGTACSYTANVNFASLPSFFTSISTSLTFGIPGGPFAFGGAAVVLSSGAVTLTLGFNAALAFSSASVVSNLTLNPGSNPVSLLLSASGAPGSGLTGASAALSVSRSGVTASASTTFSNSGGGGAGFSNLTLSASAQAGALQFQAGASFLPHGFGGAAVTGTINF